MDYQPGYRPRLEHYGHDERRRRLTRSMLASALLVFFVVTLGAAMLGSALTCPC